MKIEAIKAMQARLKKALRQERVQNLVYQDLTHTFGRLNIGEPVDRTVKWIMANLSENSGLLLMEQNINAEFRRIKVGGKNVIELLAEKMKYRASIIYGQVESFFAPTGEEIVDVGCGDGQVTDLIYRNLTPRITGFDVRHYPAPNLKVQIKKYDGELIPVSTGYFDAGLMTNVAHHEADNAKLLHMLTLIIRPGGRLVVIETVPTSDDPAEFERTFVNDYVYNRLFHSADIPVPGTYETEAGWVKRFAEVGFELEDLGSKIKNPLPLGYDQEMIRDWHTRMVFRYNGKE